MISPRIQLLPEHLIDQIKAGEVIERPASLVKELLENAIDANATKIDLHIVANGLELISIVDNGNGMSCQELPLAFCRHATSKISRFEDLYSLHSFGFRGEALASMASISRVSCASHPKEDINAGGKIIIHGGKQVSLNPTTGSSPGTSIYISDLFYNTPVRMKFVKSNISEKQAIKRIINAFLINYPEIYFSVKWDGQEKQLYPALSADQIEQRISQLFYRKEEKKEIIKFQQEYEGHKITAFLSPEPNQSNKFQQLIANNRPFNDHALHKTLVRAMEGQWGEGQSGQYVVMLSVPPDEIDVNVHPNKSHIKFFKPGIVFSLLSACREHLPQTPPKNYQIPTSAAKGISNISNATLPLSANYALVTKENKHYVINTSKLCAIYCATMLKKSYPLPDSQVVPLLICEPFEISFPAIQKHVSLLKQLGIEVDRLSNSSIVLRSIPDYLSAIFDQSLVAPLLNFLAQQTNPLSVEDIAHFYLTLSCTFPLNSRQIDSILQARPALYQTDAVCELTDQIIARIFERE